MPYKDPETRRAYFRAHSRKMREATRLYRLKNRDRINARQRAYRAKNSAQIRAYANKYYAENRERIAEQGKQRYGKNPQIFIDRSCANRARRKGVAVNDLSAAQIQEIIAAKRSRCDYCGKKIAKITLDHLTPLIKHGDHTLWNVTIACQSCNSKKGAKPPLRPVQPLLLTVAPKRKTRKKIP